MWAANCGKVNIIFNLLILLEPLAFAREPSLPPPSPLLLSPSFLLLSPLCVRATLRPPSCCAAGSTDVMTREAAVWFRKEFQPSVTTVCVWLLFAPRHVRR